MQIHITRGGQPYGPYQPEQLRQFVLQGQISLDDMAWHEGLGDWQALRTLPAFQDLALPPAIPENRSKTAMVEPVYHHISAAKFIIFSICSFGLYHLYWFYKNWAFVRDRDRSSIFPFWRSIFAVIWCHGLAKDVSITRGQSNFGSAALVAGAYAALTVAARLPDPYWLVSLFSFVPLLSIVKQIDLANRERSARSPHYARVGVWSVLFCLVGILLVSLGLVGTLAPSPSTAVVAGDQMPKTDMNFLRQEKILGDQEQVLYFYSTGIFSIKGEGSILTTKRVISYYTEDGQRTVDSLTFDKISDVEVTYSDSDLADTEVLVLGGEEEILNLALSAEEKKDQLFVDRLMELWKANKPAE